MTEDRLNKIEEMLAHQDRLIEELNDVVSTQMREISGLKNYILQIKDKMDDFAHSNDGKMPLSPGEQAARDKPPHY